MFIPHQAADVVRGGLVLIGGNADHKELPDTFLQVHAVIAGLYPCRLGKGILDDQWIVLPEKGYAKKKE